MSKQDKIGGKQDKRTSLLVMSKQDKVLEKRIKKFSDKTN